MFDITTGTTVIDTTVFPTFGSYVPSRTYQTIPAAGANAARAATGQYQAKLQCVAIGMKLYVCVLASPDSSAFPASNRTLCFYVDMAVANPSPSAVSIVSGAAVSYSATTDGTSLFIVGCNGLSLTAWRYNTTLVQQDTATVKTYGAPDLSVLDVNCSCAFGVLAIACVTYQTNDPRVHALAVSAANLASTLGTDL